MNKPIVFNKNSYKQILSALLTGKENRGQLARAAAALNTQSSYLSRVIAGELHLTPDHAFKLSQFFKFKSDERDYFLTLVDFERSGDRDYRAFLIQKLETFKKKYDSIPERTNRKELTLDAHEAKYFSGWQWTLIHFLTSIPKFQTVDAISERIGLSHKQVEYYLQELERLKFVEHRQSKWIYVGGEFHAKKDSPFVLMHHQNWRQRAILDAFQSDNDGVHYTAVQTLSRADAEKIKDLVLELISDFSKIAGPSDPEDCIVLTCDFFRA